METNNINKLKSILADMLGIEVQDINEEDTFADDLHMSASDTTDFLVKLESSGFDISGVDIMEVETITDMIDALGIRDEN